MASGVSVGVRQHQTSVTGFSYWPEHPSPNVGHRQQMFRHAVTRSDHHAGDDFARMRAARLERLGRG